MYHISHVSNFVVVCRTFSSEALFFCVFFMFFGGSRERSKRDFIFRGVGLTRHVLLLCVNASVGVCECICEYVWFVLFECVLNVNYVLGLRQRRGGRGAGRGREAGCEWWPAVTVLGEGVLTQAYDSKQLSLRVFLGAAAAAARLRFSGSKATYTVNFFQVVHLLSGCVWWFV